MGKLKVKANYNTRELEDYSNTVIEEYFKYVISVYSKSGRAMVIDARSRTKDFPGPGAASFGNITWELRSSIACAVYRDGKRVFFYGPALESGSEGVQAAKDYLEELSEGVDGIQLIVVAGKEYARAVESRGYNVISNTALIAEGILEKYINENG